MPVISWPGWPGIPSSSSFLAYLPRLLALGRFRQPLGSALLHPLGVTVLLVNQWLAFGRHFVGKPSHWKGREYSPARLSRNAKTA